jgi:drug/metabolite transporter (DMT)-like permease
VAVSLPVLVLFFSSIGWGLTWLPLKYLNQQGVQGPMLVFVAFTAGALVLLPAFARQQRYWQGQLHYLALIALFGGFANLSFQIALVQGEVIRVMILFYLLPVWSVLGGRLFLGERIDALRLVTVSGALLGAFLILGGIAMFDTRSSWVDLLAIASGMAFAMNNIVFRATQSLPVTSKVTAVFVGCTVLVGAYLLLATPEPAIFGWQPLILTMVYGVVWLTLITFGTQWGVTRLEAGRASIIIIMELAAAVVSASLLLGETLTGQELLGGLLVLATVVVETLREVATPQVSSTQA